MISVIIPTYNRVNTLIDVLQKSYFKQEFVNEIIIVNDASNDDTISLLKGLKPPQKIKLNIITNKKHLGLPQSRNIGLRHVKNNFVLFGEDDLYFPPDSLKILKEELISNGCSIIASRLINIENEEQKFKNLGHSKDPIINYKKFIGNFNSISDDVLIVPFVHACALFRREIFKDFKYSHLFIRNAFREETDLYLRAFDRGHKIGFTSKVTAYHLKNDITRNSGCGNNKKLSVKFQKHYNNIIFAIRNRKIIKRISGYNFLKIIGNNLVK